MINEYFVENRHFYVNGFADEFRYEVGDVNAVETDYVNKLFKWYMWFYKNIKADLRLKFWRDVRDDALSKCGLERKPQRKYKYHYLILERQSQDDWKVVATASHIGWCRYALNNFCDLGCYEDYKVITKRISADDYNKLYTVKKGLINYSKEIVL